MSRGAVLEGLVPRATRGSGGERAPEPEASRFEADTTQVIIRCLTARAVQKVLLSLQEVDGWAARWLNDYTATHPPLEGDKFISDLMMEAPVVLVEPTGASHSVFPTKLASGVLAVRAELALSAAKNLPGAVASSNVAVLRSHLELHTYVSGESSAPRPSYRDHRRERNLRGKWTSIRP